MSKRFRSWNLEQDFLLPPSLLEWLPENHLARFVLEVVDELDLSKIYETYEKELRGRPPHDPRMMVALLIYGYATGVVSSRKIEQKTIEDIAFRVIAGNQSPDHTRISEFRRIHGAAFQSFFVQVLKVCRKAGLVKLGHVAVDGTKMKANASKHKAMSYERMKKEEEELNRQVKQLMDEAEAVDAAEDAQYKRRRGDELPAELQRAEARVKKIREAKEAMEEEAKAARKGKDDNDDLPPSTPSTQLPTHQMPHDDEGKPTPKAQRNFTDSDSRIMKMGGTFEQAYNGQIAVDSKHQIIVAQAVTNQPPDVQHLAAVVEQIQSNIQTLPRCVTADAGYFSENNVENLETQGIDAYIATGRMKHGEAPPIVRGRPPLGLSPRGRMARKLRTKKGRELYRMRKAIVEPVFGQMKAARGIRSLLRRGMDAARQEWAFICTTHNILKMFRLGVVLES